MDAKEQLDNIRTDKQDMTDPVGEIKISVRNLVEFLLRSGNIDSRRSGAPEDAMQEGSRIHRKIQRSMGADYMAEVHLRYSYPAGDYLLTVEGRADGIIDTRKTLNTGEVTIDEIKSTYRDLKRMKGPVEVHLAQAKCYAYIYGLQNEAGQLRVRMTYCNIETEDVRYFYEEYTFEQLRIWFEDLIGQYRRWSDYEWRWRRIRQSSIEQLEFPFSYRDGQKELASGVYRTIYHKKKLYLEAPTGVGKTISTVFPAVKAVGKGLADRIFYLTAKTITRTVAEGTFGLMRERGLHFKSVILTAKEKICFMEKTECIPENCPYARGHYDRINDAIYDLLVNEESFTREKIEEYAQKYMVCPFEMCLDMSLFSDGIIGDYNYLFDPHVYLRRFFADGVKGNYIFLIDEAHNLLERGREMYSAVLEKDSLLSLKRELAETVKGRYSVKEQESKEGPAVGVKEQESKEGPAVGVKEQESKEGPAVDVKEQNSKEQVSREELDGSSADAALSAVSQLAFIPTVDAGFRVIEERIESSQGRSAAAGQSVLLHGGFAARMIKQLDKCNKEMLKLKKQVDGMEVLEEIDPLVQTVIYLRSIMDDYLEEQEENSLPVRDSILDLYFTICHFLDIYERMDENYVKYGQLTEEGDFFLKLFCVNPAVNLKECMARGRSTILFSATLLPIQYYKSLLGGEEQDYEIYARSVFNPEKRALLIAGDVTSRYTRRSDQEYLNITGYIHEIVKNRHGNYMVFCPSYSFLQNIYSLYMDHYANEETECICQEMYMKEEDREAFLGRFEGNRDCNFDSVAMEIEMDEDHSLIGFCVLGGVFSEGIDLKNDSLIGVIIIGTGIPQVCGERELLKEYFSANGENGFEYSYVYPGMNKVLQAAGRVIRTAEDVGIIALLDERFLQLSYRRLFPLEWNCFETVTLDTVARRVERFWDSWL